MEKHPRQDLTDITPAESELIRAHREQEAEAKRRSASEAHAATALESILTEVARHQRAAEAAKLDGLNRLCENPQALDEHVTATIDALYGQKPLADDLEAEMSQRPHLAAFRQRTGDVARRQAHERALYEARREASRNKHDPDLDDCFCHTCANDRVR